MTQVREREELRDTMTEAERRSTVVPTAEEVRAIVEGPPRRRQLRWMRWLGAFAALVLAAGVTALLLRSDESTTQPEVFAGGEWIISVDSPQFESLPVERPVGLPDNGYLRATQTPHGVSFDFVLVTQTPHGVSFDAFVPQPLAGNPTQLPAGLSPDGTTWQGFTYDLPEMSVAEGVHNASIANYQLPEMSVAEGVYNASIANYQLPEMSVAEGAALAAEAKAQAFAANYEVPEMSVAEGAALAAEARAQALVIENWELPETSVAEGMHNAWLENYELPEMSVAEGMEAAAEVNI